MDDQGKRISSTFSRYIYKQYLYCLPFSIVFFVTSCREESASTSLCNQSIGDW